MGDPITRMRREYPHVSKALDEQGWTLTKTTNGHLKFMSPDKLMIIGSGTPGKSGSDKALLAHLKRAGLDFNPNRPRPQKVKELPIMEVLLCEGDGVDDAPPPWPEKRDVGDVLLTSAQAAQMMSVNLQTLARWRDAGLLLESPNPNRVGRGRYFLRANVEAFMKTEEYRPVKKYKLRVREHPDFPETVDRQIAPAPIEELRVVVSRRSMELMSLPELAEAIAGAMAEQIEVAVQKAITKAVTKLIGAFDE